MTQSDRLIPEDAKCKVCAGAGWTASTTVQPPEEPRWVVCRECIGTGRSDHKGRKRQPPSTPPTG
jgi:DnaJ-class molecular chaperone